MTTSSVRFARRSWGHYAQQDYLVTARVLKTKKLLGNRFTYYVYATVPGFLGGGTGTVAAAHPWLRDLSRRQHAASTSGRSEASLDEDFGFPGTELA